MTTIIVRRPERALIGFEPFFRSMSLFDEIEELAREAWDSWQPAIFRTGLMPHLDMYEEDGKLVIKTELPDVRKEDLDISLEGDVLTIKAEKKREEVGDSAKHYTGERYFGQYLRSISLPFHVDADKASATFENGLLEVRFPKVEVTRRIEIKVQLPKGGEKKPQRKRKKSTS